MGDLFDINPDCIVSWESIDKSRIWCIKDFYKRPDDIVEYIKSHEPKYHKRHSKTRNGIEFHDMRHGIDVDITHVYKFLQRFCRQTYSTRNPKKLSTNYIRFEPVEFNSYKDHYWWPHYDSGFTALIYLNKDDDECGTNLYEFKEPRINEKGKMYDMEFDIHEHVKPWKEKSRYKLIRSIPPTYNSCVIFDGAKFLHGQNVSNVRYFGEEFRLNQVIFFDSNPNYFQ
ncbi:hypothetical protein S820908_165 [Synechococcus phage S-CAM9]|uniref:Uncharacterized protein n=1 Tax=Synechococcus phage S-CAM9 TaxID=1883369 RepID=A0A1D8KPD9_9CAUD|nr:minor coat protein [Synechococcus phage S-CAM9]AOV60312.1 hypothetical protein S050808_165 [Synechococcus phage S-CAM9]AOV60540.1 hypothetical protein S820908_165 [Synechococcus phage S-CAM9]AOV60769.1 hypothetical protein N161109_166 [Synechococcus phage S-CAM9]